jgi:hypothetical protein
MSDAIFPDLPGLAFDKKTNTEFKTVIHNTAAGGETRGRFSGYPFWLFRLNYTLLDNFDYDDLTVLHGFHCQRGGMFDSFLYRHQHENRVDDGLIGTGNGSRTAWPLRRSFGGFTEPCENVDALESVSVGGVVLAGSAYDLGATGIITFDNPPADGAVIRATFSYFYRCRFESDVTDFTEFANLLYSHEDFGFRGSVVNKV